MTAAILVPSLNRPHRLRFVVDNIHSNTFDPHRILFCVSDDESKAILTKLGEWFLDDSDDEDRRYVTRMNKLVRHLADDEDLIFYGSDDVIHHSGWLAEAVKVMDQGYSLVVVNDGRNPNGTQALMRREYLDLAVYDSPGDAFHHGYIHNFADNEQHFTSFKRHQYARAMDSHVEHLHPIFQAANAIEWDATYTDAMKGWDHDAALFDARAKLIDAAL